MSPSALTGAVGYTAPTFDRDDIAEILRSRAVDAGNTGALSNLAVMLQERATCTHRGKRAINKNTNGLLHQPTGEATLGDSQTLTADGFWADVVVLASCREPRSRSLLNWRKT